MSNIGFALDVPNSPDAPVSASFLESVRAAGFNFVLWHADPAGDAAAACTMLEEARLKPIAVAFPTEAVLPSPEKSMEIAETLGVPDVVLLLEGAELADEGGLAQSIRKVGQSAVLFEAAGLRLLVGFRNMVGLEYAAIIARFAAELEPDMVGFMPDSYEICRANGGNPADIIRSLPDRCPLLSLSDLGNGGSGPCALGEGQLAWDDIFDAGEEAAVEWYLCRAPGIPVDMESAQKSLSYLTERA